MGQPCRVCIHPQREAINAALLGGMPNRRVAARFGLVESSVRRHKGEHIPMLIATAKEARDMLSAEALAARMAELEADVNDVRDRGKRKGDDRLRLLAVAQGRGNVETLAKLAALYIAQQRQAQEEADARAIEAPSEPPTFEFRDPEEIRTVLKYLIEAGAAIPPPPMEPPATSSDVPYDWPRREDTGTDN